MKLSLWRVLPLVIFSLLAFFLWRGLSLEPHNLPSAKIGKPLPEFKLPILGNQNDNFTSQTVKGQVSLINVWASWCAACSEEQVFLLQLAREGLPIYGLNYKDNPKNAKQWLAEWGNPYKKIGIDLHGRTAIDLGVYGAPETFLIDEQGVVLARHAGILNKNIWEKEFRPLIKKLKMADLK